ncbi:MAG: ABC transporter permease [Deltaproteobacteria bacterium]|nr:ABC transporter permease [Deltaproteobacteria bacterium]MBW1955520.1 ABC transporter permease [Deltaproteobacteria bacterium]MBW2042371.1 ABC transporter permease [Deltaproteobacteria bacterium]MBW2132929.1 ABC transporter permease [Deltaproteobacteria bacterium]
MKEEVLNKRFRRTRDAFRAATRVFRNPVTTFGALILVLLIATALFAPYIAPFPDQGRGLSNLEERLAPPSLRHPLGTDNLGRDILSRLIFGARISLKAALLVVSIVVLVGVPLGLIAGYIGGKVDEFIMRFADMILAFPSLLLAIAIVASLGPNLFNALIAISLPWWPWYTRLMRSQVVTVKESPFIESARAVGVSSVRIMLRHILPNCLSPIIVQATLDMGYIVLSIAALGFLGLGTQPPAADWGVMVSDGREFFLKQWWISTFSGGAIFLSVLGFNLVGDGIREAMDPKIRWRFQRN